MADDSMLSKAFALAVFASFLGSILYAYYKDKGTTPKSGCSFCPPVLGTRRF